MIQSEFELYPAHKKANADEISMMSVLKSYGDWYTAKELHGMLGISDRTCREIAQHSDGKIISGQRGYKATAYATPDEINHACYWLWSQADKMSKRATEIKRVAHQALKPGRKQC